MTEPTPDVDTPTTPAASRPFRVVVDDGERRPWIGPDIPAGDYLLIQQDGGFWVLIPQPQSDRPYRAVDRYGRGWLTCADPVHTYPSLDGPALTLETLTEQRGPLVPVVRARRDDCDTIRLALAGAGEKALASLLAALSFVSADCEASDNSRDRLVAGRPGSWESELLLSLSVFGDGIMPHRTDLDTVADIRTVLTTWVFGETGRVEVAETLADILGDVIDGRGGWNQITDQQLRQSRIAEHLHHYVTYQSSAHSPR
jgi:hypothetical protein